MVLVVGVVEILVLQEKEFFLISPHPHRVHKIDQEGFETFEVV